MAGDIAQNRFGNDHALRPAKASEGGVALGVELAAVRGDVYVLQKIGVVHVKNRPVGHRAGQVGAEAAGHQHLQLQAAQAATVIKTHCVVVAKRMPFAGQHEVVVAIKPQFDGLLELLRRHRRPHRHMPSLGFFATKAATHAATRHLHRVVVYAQRVRHPVLHLTGVLRAAVNEPLVLLLRQGISHLAFQVKVFLATDFERAVQRVRCACQRLGGIAPAHRHRRLHKALQCLGRTHVQHRRQGFNLGLHLAGSVACLHHAAGHHHAHHLADKLHRVLGKYRLVTGKGGQHLVARHIGGQQHRPHAGHGACGLGVHAKQLAVCHLGQNGRGVQRAAYLGDVIHVRRAARNVRCGTLMWVGLTSGRAVQWGAKWIGWRSG